jgi:hypothetical protein
VYLAGGDGRIKDQGLVVNPQSAFSSFVSRRVRELNVDSAFGNDSTIGIGRTGVFIPIAVNQAGRRRRLNDSTAVKFGYPEVTQSSRGNIHRIADNPLAPGVGVENPRHVVRPGGHCLGDFHEHADNPARAVLYPEHVADPALIQPYVGPNGGPFVVTVLERSYYIAFPISRHVRPRLQMSISICSPKPKEKGRQGFP